MSCQFLRIPTIPYEPAHFLSPSSEFREPFRTGDSPMTHFFWSPTSPIDPAHFTHTYGRSGKRRWLTHREFYNLSCSERPSWNEA